MTTPQTMKTNLPKRNSIYITNNSHRKEVAAFDIDMKVKDGRLALMYRGNTNKP